MFTVAAGILPAVEPGILPSGYSYGFRHQFLAQRSHSGRQDAALYGSQDGRRYTRVQLWRHLPERGEDRGEGHFRLHGYGLAQHH